MITIRLSEQPILEHKTQGLVFFVAKDTPYDHFRSIADRYYPLLEEIFKKERFDGGAGSQVVVPARDGNRLVYLIFLGMGDGQDYVSVEMYRRALGSLIRLGEKYKLTSLALQVPVAGRFKETPEYLAQQTACILFMASYHFDKYITDDSRKPLDIEITLVILSADLRAYTKGLQEGEIIGRAVNKARVWVDMPPSDLTPPELARHAQMIAQKHGLKITVFSEEEVKKMGMGGLAGVAAGSEQDCNLVVMEYTAPHENASRVGIVGKGITFDSGGLSIKPAHHMENMKEDMAGAAAVIATMEVIAQLKPSIHVVAVVPLAENLPSGTATKPGDILRFYNGKTAEVRNTDAEGRLILADALSYAVKHYKLDALIDLATLTGACAHALGTFFAGMMGKNEELMNCVEVAARSSGERVWPLPFDDDYKAAISSSVADMCNIGNSKYLASAITAGFFLYNFVDDVPWVHLDIAGVAFNVPDISYYRPGATGYGVRLLTEFIMHWKY